MTRKKKLKSTNLDLIVQVHHQRDGKYIKAPSVNACPSH